MRAKRMSILAVVILLPVIGLVLLLSRACQAQEGTPTPEIVPAEPVEVLQERGVLPQTTTAAGLTLIKTVGTGPIVSPSDCPTSEFIHISGPTRVDYCYRIANTGDVDLTSHTLVDSQLGTLFSDYLVTLAPGQTGIFTQSVVVSTTTVNAATWTASDAGGTTTVSADDRAGVFLADPQPLVCGGPAVNFDQGVPSDWQVFYQQSENPIYWTNVDLSWEKSNYTGGSGDAASASSRYQNGGSGLYDTELRSPAFSLNGAGTVSLRYLANYQHNTNDALDLGVSINGGASWATLLHWNSTDHGRLGGTPGESVTVDLSAYSGQGNVMLRWRYYNLDGPASQTDLYAQIDQVSLTCKTNAAISLNKTASTDPSCSGAGEVNLVAPGTRLTYCYKVFNTGPNLLTVHDLVDSQLGVLLNGFIFDLAPIPGASAILPQPVTILTDTVSNATWTAANPDLGLTASSSDTLTIRVGKASLSAFCCVQSQSLIALPGGKAARMGKFYRKMGM